MSTTIVLQITDAVAMRWWLLRRGCRCVSEVSMTEAKAHNQHSRPWLSGRVAS